MYSSILNLFLVITYNIVLFSGIVNTNQQFNEWVLEKEEDGIKVYTKLHAGDNIKEFKAITTTTQKMDVLERILEDVEAYSNWQENVTTSTLLKQVNPHEQYIYYTTDAPWPVADRDVISHLIKTESSDGTTSYRLNAIPDYQERDEKYIRLTVAKGLWQLTPIADGKIKIVYQFYGDPAGSIPDWLVNIFIVSGPFNTLKNLKRL